MIGYLDTSAWIAWKFKQEGGEILKSISFADDTLVSNPLLVTEYISFLNRENFLQGSHVENDLAFVRWVYPLDPLINEALDCIKGSMIRGADLLHLATALWFAEGRMNELTFLSCDKDQRDAARALGFKTKV